MNGATTVHIKLLDRVRVQDTRTRGNAKVEGLLAYMKGFSMILKPNGNQSISLGHG